MGGSAISPLRSDSRADKQAQGFGGASPPRDRVYPRAVTHRDIRFEQRGQMHCLAVAPGS